MKTVTFIYSAILIISMVFSNSIIELDNSSNIENEISTTVSMDPFLGQVAMFAGNFAPRGWAFCDGELLLIEGNHALFAIIGTTYGGDGRTTFALPNLESESGVNYIIAIQGVFPARN